MDGYIDCSGTVTLTSAKATTAMKGKHLKLGSAHFKLGSGKSQTVTIKLSQKALKHLLGSTRIVITVSDSDAAGHTATAHHSTKLKLPKRRK